MRTGILSLVGDDSEQSFARSGHEDVFSYSRSNHKIQPLARARAGMELS